MMRNKTSHFGRWLDSVTFKPKGPSFFNNYVLPIGWYEGDYAEDTFSRVLMVTMGLTLFCAACLLSPLCGAIKALDCLIEGGTILRAFLLFFVCLFLVFVAMCTPNAIISQYHTKKPKRYISSIYKQNFKFVKKTAKFSAYEISILSLILGQAAKQNSAEYFSCGCANSEEAEVLASRLSNIMIQKGEREIRMFWDMKADGDHLVCQISDQVLRLLHGENIDHR